MNDMYLYKIECERDGIGYSPAYIVAPSFEMALKLAKIDFKPDAYNIIYSITTDHKKVLGAVDSDGEYELY